jgi:hypothetical protein
VPLAGHSGESGEFQILVEPGTQVGAVAPGAGPTVVSARELKATGVLRLEADSSVVGSVLTAAGAPIPGAEVRLRIDKNGALELRQRVSADGKFAFLGLPAGHDFVLFALADGVDLPPRPFQTSPGEVRVDLLGRGASTLSMKVVTAPGAPCAHAFVRVDSRPFVVSVTEGGTYTFDGDAQRRHVRIVPELFREKGKGGIQVLPKETDVVLEPNQVVEVQVDPAPSIGGRVLDRNGTPIVGAVVRLKMTDDLDLRSVDPAFVPGAGYECVTDAAGRFALGVPKAGEYRATVTADGCAPLDDTTLWVGSNPDVTLSPAR